ncbi:MAG: tryptophan synthase subunit alpha [Rhodothermales bacterium]|nr:tryptophan synthase subunit alpha [Rhodothermales bacterium]
MSLTSQLAATIRSAHDRNESALGIFVTSGFPSPDRTLDVLSAVVRGGADFVELGMPFSDPLAEGLPIQRSSERALRHGIRMRDTLQTAADFRAAHDVPLVLMGYANPVLRFGLGNFFDAAHSSGVQGVILPDVPPEEADPFLDAASRAGIDLIMLVSPTTPDERIRRIDEMSSGFVYAVSVTGVTGTTLGAQDQISSYLDRVRSLLQRNPLMVGFGIRTQADVRRLSRSADGCIVGSALIELIEECYPASSDGRSDSDAMDRIAGFVRSLKVGTRHE